MGIITMGIPAGITLFLRDNFHCNTFIETGTFYGGTATWAAQNFEKVYTIEYSKEIFEATSTKYAHIKNISFCYGDTRTLLKDIIIQNQNDPLIIWLDAHWCSGATFGENDQCPLIDEIKALNTSDADQFILIDDARLFLSPPPLPHSLKQYPTIARVIEELNKKLRFIAVYDDVIFAIPVKHESVFREFLQSKITNELVAQNSTPYKTPLATKVVRKLKSVLNSLINNKKSQ
ncbi:MAG: hypothetical protein JWR67_962 [Mucilaginibacter sp.]|nr:hypothetical protein [Mucilaginibacter sp.]